MTHSELRRGHAVLNAFVGGGLRCLRCSEHPRRDRRPCAALLDVEDVELAPAEPSEARLSRGHLRRRCGACGSPSSQHPNAPSPGWPPSPRHRPCAAPSPSSRHRPALDLRGFRERSAFHVLAPAGVKPDLHRRPKLRGGHRRDAGTAATSLGRKRSAYRRRKRSRSAR